ncbi:MAG: hypothetical protein AABY22_35680, partial [Nanoarchaeota archaeon]
MKSLINNLRKSKIGKGLISLASAGMIFLGTPNNIDGGSNTIVRDGIRYRLATKDISPLGEKVGMGYRLTNLRD